MRIKGLKKAPYSGLLRLIQCYILFTFLLFLIGPITWQNDNDFLLSVLMLAYLAALTMGYRFGARKKLRQSRHRLLLDVNLIKITKILIWLGIIYSVIYILRYGRTFSVSQIIQDTIYNLLNPADKYAETQAGAMENANLLGGGFLSLVVTFSGPITIPAAMLPILYFQKLPRSYKILGIFGIILQMVGGVIAGTNEGVFDIVIFVMAAILIKMKKKPLIKRRKGNWKAIILLSLLLIGLLSFFTNNIGQRTAANFAFPTIGVNKYNSDAAILNFVPLFLQPTLAYLTVYLCEGYYGMALALKLEWIPTWGTGFSSFIRNNLEELLNVDLIQYSYQGRAEIFGWGANRNWHTAYTWFANDVSFIGVILIMFIIGWLISRTYRDAVENQNPFACMLFGILLMQILFLSANNKIFASSTTFIPFWLFLFLWKFTKNVNQIKTGLAYRE